MLVFPKMNQAGSKFGIRKRWNPALSFGFALVVIAVCACRDRSETSAAQEQNEKPAAQLRTQSGPETAQEKSCRVFVQRFYDWYFDRLNQVRGKVSQSRSNSDDVVRLKPELLTVPLLQLLVEDREAVSRNPGEIVGLDFDPYINAQDWEGTYWVQSVTVQGSKCRAAVWGTDAGTKRDMVDPELEFGSGKWVITNFHYPGNSLPRDENLIAMLIGLRTHRKHSQQ